MPFLFLQKSFVVIDIVWHVIVFEKSRRWSDECAFMSMMLLSWAIFDVSVAAQVVGKKPCAETTIPKIHKIIIASIGYPLGGRRGKSSCPPITDLSETDFFPGVAYESYTEAFESQKKHLGFSYRLTTPSTPRGKGQAWQDSRTGVTCCSSFGMWGATTDGPTPYGRPQCRPPTKRYSIWFMTISCIFISCIFLFACMQTICEVYSVSRGSCPWEIPQCFAGWQSFAVIASDLSLLLLLHSVFYFSWLAHCSCHGS